MRRCEVLHCYRRYWLRYWRGGISALRWFHHLADEWVVLFFAQDPRQGFGSSPHVRSGIGVFPIASAGFPCLPAGCSRRISFALSGSSPRAKPGIKVRGQPFLSKPCHRTPCCHLLGHGFAIWFILLNFLWGVQLPFTWPLLRLDYHYTFVFHFWLGPVFGFLSFTLPGLFVGHLGHSCL